MKVAIMQPYFLPYIGYWQLINVVDVFVIYDDVNYINKGWINRNRILLNGEAHTITLSLLQSSQNKLINQILVGSNKDKLMKTIAHAYKKAPYFEQVYPIVEQMLNCNEQNLALFLGDAIQLLVNFLDLSTKIVYSSSLSYDRETKGQTKIIEIAKQLGASTYINAIGGKALYEASAFEREHIKLKFLESHKLNYQQFDNEFVPWLSIIDVMMFNENGKIKLHLDNGYALG